MIEKFFIKSITPCSDVSCDLLCSFDITLDVDDTSVASCDFFGLSSKKTSIRPCVVIYVVSLNVETYWILSQN